MTALDLALLTLRVVVGVVMFAHGYNHLFGGGRIAGTTRWFASLGMRPAALHAWTASLTELGAGLLLVLGLAVPLAGAAVTGVMMVAWVTNHLRNGFFIFRAGEGYEYVMVLTAAGAAFCGTGGGRISIDHLVGVGAPSIGVAAGCLGSAVVASSILLLFCWRPEAEA